LIYNDETITNPSQINEILDDAGGRIGLLDYRTQKSGEFGQFKVTKFEVKTNGNRA
jgi:hypothetical protein